MFGGHSEMDVPYYVMVPLHLLYVWYGIQSFGYVFLYMLWIRMKWMQRQFDVWASILYSFFDMLRNGPYAIDMFRNVPFAIDMLRKV